MRYVTILGALLFTSGAAVAQTAVVGSIGDVNAQTVCGTVVSSDNSTRCANTSFVQTHPPTGTAGGDLAGTYPNPTVNSVSVTALPATGAPAQIGAIAKIKKQSFCASGCTTTVASGSSGSYTPSPGLMYAIVEIVGGGGGGGNAVGSAGVITNAGGGGGGGYVRVHLNAADFTAPVTIQVGAAGVGGASSSTGTNGGYGGSSAFGSSHVAGGGGGGTYGASGTSGQGGAGGTVTTTTSMLLSGVGSPGGNSLSNSGYFPSGSGGASGNGGGGASGGFSTSTNVFNGRNATGYGGGGSGGYTNNGVNGLNAAGGNGAPGMVSITEFCNQ